MNYEKEWNFHDLNEKEKAAYLKKEEAYFTEQKKRDDLESAWRKGKISEKEYLNKDRYHADNQQRLLFPNRYKSDEKKVKKVKGKEKKRREASKEVKKVAKAKKNRKKYSAAEKASYHQSRVNSSNVTKNQKAYSRSWLDGFRDPHADQNLKAIKSELKQRKALIKERQEDIKVIKDGNNTVYAGYINGAKAGIKKK